MPAQVIRLADRRPSNPPAEPARAFDPGDDWTPRLMRFQLDLLEAWLRLIRPRRMQR